MKKLYIIQLLSITIFLSNSIVAQTIYFSDDFENGNFNGWNQEYVTQSWNWIVAEGTGQASHPPISAYEGDYNAAFYRNDGLPNVTKLITPIFNLEFAIKPELSFFLSQYYFEDAFGSGNSKLSLYYRSAEIGNQWIKLKEYNDSIVGWAEQVVLIPDSLRYSSVQLAFEGRFNDNEHGVCVDNIEVIETGIIPKYLDAISAIQASDDVIPTSSSNNPILRLRFTVKGNDGSLKLDSLVVDALDDAEFVIGENGIKLFTTVSTNFYDTVQIGTASSFEAGKAIFNNIDYDLPFGNTYVWVTYDVPIDEFNNFKGKIVDAKISPYSIKVNNNYYSDLELNPYGYREISKSLFFDNFEGDNFWTLSGEFELDNPTGLSGHNRGNPDPTYAFSGKKVLGTDLTGLGTFEGAYELNLAENTDIAKTDTIINAKYYKNIKLGFYRWLNANSDDNVSIEISLDNGGSWTNIWKNDVFYLETKYAYKSISLGNIADRQSNLAFRYVVGPTGSYSYSGWNIDNFAITGTFIEDDAGFLSLISPSEGCGHLAPEPVNIVIQNYGYSPTNDTVPVGYSIDGGNTWVMDTLFETIPRDGIANFEFSELIDLTEPGYHNILVKTFYTGDEDSRNDMLDTTLFSSPTYTLPYSQNFEDDEDFWRSLGENQTWEFGNPSDNIIDQANSGENCWVTDLSGNYPNNDSSYLESPCFDFTNIDKPIFECMIWADGEINNDGLALYYSIDNGNEWTFVPTETVHSFDWDWYNNPSIAALGTDGWDSVTNGWFKTRQILPNAVANQNGVKFRMLFASNDTITKAGFAIDDVRIFDAPTDAGVVEIVTPTDDCYLSDMQQIKIGVKNYGIRLIKPTDLIYASLDYSGETVLTDTFSLATPLATDDTVQLTFSSSLDMFNKLDYDLVIYTHIPGDTTFYIEGNYNDTIVDTITVYGEPYFTLGPDIGTLTPENEVLSVDINFIDAEWTNHYNSNTQNGLTYNVPVFPGGTDDIDFSVIITNDSSCLAYDTIKVIKSISDLGVIIASGTIDTCINRQSNQDLDITVQNFSNDTIYQIGDNITVGYSFIADSNYNEEITLTSTLGFNETVDYSFVTPPVFPDSGSYSLKVFSVIYADLDYSNDTSELPIKIFRLPEVEIGEDTVFTINALNVIDSLNAYSDYFASYKWQDNSTDSIFNIVTNENFKYFVEVADTNECGIASDTVVIVADNWVVDSITSPVTSCSLSANEQVTVVVNNSSPNTYSIGYELLAEISFDGSKKMDTIVLTENLLPDSDINYTFSPEYDMNSVKEYDISIQIFPEQDIDITDNSISEEVNVWGIYPVDIGPDSIVTKRADTIIIDAGSKYSTYKWQDFSTDRYYYIQTNNSLKYYIDVDDENGCSSSSDTLRIVSYDVGVTEILTPSSVCDLEGTDKIRFTLQNFGPDVVPIGTTISYFYNINEGDWIEKIHNLDTDLEPGTSASIIIFEDIDFEDDETYTMKLYSRWNRDHFFENDTASKIIYEFETPSVDLGEDIFTTIADTVVIDGGKNHTTYTWNDGLGTRYYPVTKTYSEKYFVTVTNAFGCFDSDSVNIFTYDISVSSIETLNNCEATENNTVSINIQLNSNDTLRADDEIDVSYNFNEEEVTETIVLTDTFTRAETLPYTFNTKFNVADTGNYTITCSVNLENEVVTDNNSLSTNFRIGAFPVDLGDDIVTYESSVTIDAGSEFISYLWSNESTEQTIEVSSPGKYIVTVTDINSCSASDSVNVLFLNPGYEISEINNLNNSCIHAIDEIILFTLLNTGNDTLKSETEIPISFEINGSDKVDETYTFTEDFKPGVSIDIEFLTKADLSNYGEYSILVSANINNKITSLDSTVNTWAKPVINLGDDIQSPDETVILDAGEGFSSYIWITNETTQLITVNANGDYWVKVTNNNSCENSDTVNVYFLPVDLKVNKFIKPLSGCAVIDNEEVTIIVKNTGSKVVPSGTIISLGYQFDEDDRINETVEFANDMQPNANLTYNFTNRLSVQESGVFDIEFFVTLGNTDIDNATYSIDIYEKPTFFDGQDTIKVSEYPYELNSQVSAESYLWNTGETTSTITANSFGDYWLTIVTENQCEFTDSIYLTRIISVNDIWSSQISVYPNPGESEISIILPQNIEKVTMQITDLDGKTVYIKDNVSGDMQLNISDWSQGIYLLRIFNGSNIGMYQIIKQ